MSTQQRQLSRDLDFLNGENFRQDHFRAWDALREAGEPVIWTDAAATYGVGYWVPTNYEAGFEAMHNYRVFSNRLVRGLLPEGADPPRHRRYRKVLDQMFAPAAVEALEDRIRAWAVELIDALDGQDEIDYMAGFARRFPSTLFLRLFGWSAERSAELVADEIALAGLEGKGGQPAYAGMPAPTWKDDISALIVEMLELRRVEPADDWASMLVHSTAAGEPLSADDVAEMARQLYEASMDTIAGSLGYFLMHFAQNPGDRQRILDDPALIPSAIEELLRYYSLVTLPREIATDTEFHGVPLRVGQKVWIPTACMNRDPQEFPDADKVIIDRFPNRHVAFGSGPHRCVGSHLARVELRVAIEEWHRRFPHYHVNEEAVLWENRSGNASLMALPLVIERR
jgi:cytochrome P450